MPRRRFDGIAGRQRERHHQEDPGRHHTRHRRAGERDRDDDHPRFRIQNELPPVDDVANCAGRQRQQEKRQGRRGLRQRNEQRTGAERHHQPRRSDRLHECADIRDRAGQEQLPECRIAQRPQQSGCPAHRIAPLGRPAGPSPSTPSNHAAITASGTPAIVAKAPTFDSVSTGPVANIAVAQNNPKVNAHETASAITTSSRQPTPRGSRSPRAREAAAATSIPAGRPTRAPAVTAHAPRSTPWTTTPALTKANRTNTSWTGIHSACSIWRGESCGPAPGAALNAFEPRGDRGRHGTTGINASAGGRPLHQNPYQPIAPPIATSGQIVHGCSRVSSTVTARPARIITGPARYTCSDCCCAPTAISPIALLTIATRTTNGLAPVPRSRTRTSSTVNRAGDRPAAQQHPLVAG